MNLESADIQTHRCETLADLFAPDNWRPEAGGVGETISAAWVEGCGITFAALVAAWDLVDPKQDAQPGRPDQVTRIIREQDATRRSAARASRRGQARRRTGRWGGKAAAA